MRFKLRELLHFSVVGQHPKFTKIQKLNSKKLIYWESEILYRLLLSAHDL